MCGYWLIDSLTIRAVDGDVLATDSGKLYGHADEPIFVFLIVGSERILMHDYDLGLRRTASFGKVWQHLFNSSDEGGFSLRNVGSIQVWHEVAPRV